MPERLTVEQFGQRVKSKYPEYADMADAEVGQKILQKHPQYQDMVETAGSSSPQTEHADQVIRDTFQRIQNQPSTVPPIFRTASQRSKVTAAPGTPEPNAFERLVNRMQYDPTKDTSIQALTKGPIRALLGLASVPYAFLKPASTPEEAGAEAGGGRVALALKRLAYDPSAQNYQQAQQDVAQGDDVGAAIHAAGTVPLVGPLASGLAEGIRRGDPGALPEAYTYFFGPQAVRENPPVRVGVIATPDTRAVMASAFGGRVRAAIGKTQEGWKGAVRLGKPQANASSTSGAARSARSATQSAPVPRQLEEINMRAYSPYDENGAIPTGPGEVQPATPALSAPASTSDLNAKIAEANKLARTQGSTDAQGNLGPATPFPSRQVQITPLDQTIVDTHNSTGGSTFTLDGKNQTGKRLWAVGIAPRDSVHIPAGQELSPATIATFREEHRDFLSKPNTAIGTWKDDDGSHWLDVVALTPNTASATRHGQLANQKGIARLDTLEFRPTGGTGETLADTPDRDSLLASLSAEIPEKQPYSGRHFSWNPIQNNVLSGARRGTPGKTGQPTGEEAFRLQLGKGAEPGVYFYDEGTKGEPQIIIRPHEYGLSGQYAIADTGKPGPAQDIWSETYNRVFEENNGKRSPEGFVTGETEARGLALNEAERALAEAGYDGYRNSATRYGPKNATFLFGDHAVTPVGQEPAVPTAQPKPQTMPTYARWDFPEEMDEQVQQIAQAVPGASAVRLPGRGVALHAPAESVDAIQSTLAASEIPARLAEHDRQQTFDRINSTQPQFALSSWENPLANSDYARMNPYGAMEDALQNMNVAVEQVPELANAAVVRIDKNAHYALSNLWHVPPQWGGANYAPEAIPDLQKLTERSAREWTSDPRALHNVATLNAAIEHAAMLNGRAGVSFVVNELSPEERGITDLHEVVAHGGQNVLAGGGEKPFTDVKYLRKSAPVMKAARALQDQGYAKSSFADLIHEIGAYLVSGEEDRLGLSADELPQLYVQMWESMVSAHGQVKLSDPPTLAREFVNRVWRGANEQGRSNQAADQHIPTVHSASGQSGRAAQGSQRILGKGEEQASSNSARKQELWRKVRAAKTRKERSVAFEQVREHYQQEQVDNTSAPAPSVVPPILRRALRR